MILIPIKVLSHECIKAVDEYIPELVEALSSQMDPQVVCAIAQLCNNARLDKLIAEYKVMQEHTEWSITGRVKHNVILKNG